MSCLQIFCGSLSIKISLLFWVFKNLSKLPLWTFSFFYYFIFKMYLFLNLFLAALGHHCCTQAQYLWCMGLVAPQHVGSPRTRAQTVSPELAGRFLTTAPPGKSLNIFYFFMLFTFFSLSSTSVFSISSILET